MGKVWARYLTLLCLVSFSARAEIIDLPNPFEDSSPADISPLPIVAPAVNTKPPVSSQQQEALGRFSGKATITEITRKTGGLVYRLEVKPAVSIRKISISAKVSQLALHESYVITESGKKIKIQEFSHSAVVANKAIIFSEELRLSERISAIDLRSESMGAESDIEVVAYSDDATVQLQIFNAPQTTIAGSSSSKLTCRWNGRNHQPFNASKNIFLGKNGYGFDEIKTCQESLQIVRGYGEWAVCNNDGRSWAVYRTTDGKQIGRTGFGFSEIEECHKAIADATNGLLCSWSGGGYSPYIVTGTTNVGVQNYGIAEYEVCAQNITTAQKGVLCQWNGLNYQPYVISNNKPIGKLNHGFADLNECQMGLKRIANGFVCNWSGQGYSRYSLESSPEMVGNVYKNVESCVDTK